MAISLEINGFFPPEFKYDLFYFHFHFNGEEEKQISYSQNNKITYKIPLNQRTGLNFQIKITRSDFLIGICELKIPYAIISKKEKNYDQLCAISMTESMKKFIFGDNTKNFLKTHWLNTHLKRKRREMAKWLAADTSKHMFRQQQHPLPHQV